MLTEIVAVLQWLCNVLRKFFMVCPLKSCPMIAPDVNSKQVPPLYLR